MKINRKSEKRGHGRYPRGHETAAPSTKWSVRILRLGSLSGDALYEFTFPTRGGGASKLCVPASEIGHPRGLLDQLYNRLPIFPKNCASTDQAHFVQNLANKYHGPIDIVPDRKGFLNPESFVTHTQVLHANGTCRPVATLESDPTTLDTDVAGTLEGTSRDVLKIATTSSYLAFAIGVALAAPLPSYLRLNRSGERDRYWALTETAVFNFSGLSGSGKTSVELGSLSLSGSPNRASNMNFSPRGLAELAAESNDLLLVLDDTETAEHGGLLTALKSIVQIVSAGRSKRISKGADQGKYPMLRWSTIGLSSSPRPIVEVAAQAGWTMSRGNLVRIFDIAVPGPEQGGVFDRLDCPKSKRSRRSIKMIGRLERGYLENHGHVIGPWVQYLMKKNRAERIVHLVDHFVKDVGANRNGWEARFARKVGLIYAAMVLGVKSGLLPWPASLPLKVAKLCYRKARAAAVTAEERNSGVVAKLARVLSDPARIVDARKNAAFTRMAGSVIAIRYRKNGRSKIGLLDGALRQIVGSNAAKKKLTAALVAANVIAVGHGHAGTIQEHLPIKRSETVISRPRLWVLDERRFLRYCGDHAF